MSDALRPEDLAAAADEIARLIGRRLDDATATHVTLSRDEAVLTQGMLGSIAALLAQPGR